MFSFSSLAALIRSEPVGFWCGAVGAVLTLATWMGLSVPPPDKAALTLLINVVCVLVSRGQVSPTAGPPPIELTPPGGNAGRIAIRMALASALVGALALPALFLGGCASLSPTASAALLDASKALDGTITLFDTAVDSAEALHQSGLLVGADWTKAKQLIAQINGYVTTAKNAQAVADSASMTTEVNLITALLPQLVELTNAHVPAAPAAAPAAAGPSPQS